MKLTHSFHTLPRDHRKDLHVSSISKWDDVIWTLDNLTPGASRSSSTIRWDIEIREGELLTDERWTLLRESLKTFVWSLFNDRRHGRALKAGTLGQISVGLRTLLRWFMSAHVESLNQLTKARLEMFIDWHCEQIIEKHGEEGLTEGRFMKSLSIWAYLWEQSSMLAEAGLQYLSEDPFRGTSCIAKCEQLAIEAPGRIPPLPDELAIPICSAAWDFLGQRAEDVITLQDRYFRSHDSLSTLRKGATLGSCRLNAIARVAITSFQFSTLPGDTAPWRSPIKPEEVETIRQERSHHTPPQALRNLILDVRDAATMTIQSGIGLRSSELCGLKAGWTGEWPNCIELCPSVDGGLELFFLKGVVAKAQKVPKSSAWVMGCRPAGSSYVPPTVRAVMVLHKLLAPWRELGRRDELLVSFSSPHGLPKSKGSIAASTVEKLAQSQKNFILRHVDLTAADTAKVGKRCLLEEYRPHRWRKTFAQYVLRTSPTLIRALSKHFKHMSIAMTEKGYLGNDRFLEIDLASTRQRMAGRFLFEMITGKRAAFGPFAKWVQEHSDRLLSETRNDEEVFSNVMVLVREHDVRAHYAGHGKCFVSLFPLDSKCNQLGGTATWATRNPNFAKRDPSVCLGCKCYAIDAEHEVFWVRREDENRQMQIAEESVGRVESAYVFRHRANQANAIVNAIKVGRA